MADRANLIDRYENCADVFADAVRRVSVHLLDQPTAPGKWSIRQIAVHTTDAEIVFSARLRAIAGQDGATIIGFDENGWATSMVYEKQPVMEAVALFQALRHANSALMRVLPEEAWQHRGNHNEKGPVQLADLLNHFISHGENHTRAIGEAAKKLAAAAGADS